MSARSLLTPARLHTRGRRRAHLAALPLAAAAVLLATGCAAGPPQPTTGLGANGPCTSTTTSIPDPNASGQTINITVPGGSAAAPIGGGTCDAASRPVVIVVHGLLAGIPAVYQDLVTHLVSVGNVVVFATYNTDTNDFVGSYNHEDAALVTAKANPATARGDFSRLGIIGHSMGGGAVPYLAKKAAARGWGATSFWLMPLAPWYAAGIGTGPIDVPAHTRVVVEGYDNDTLVDNRIGIELYKAFTVPAAQKQHVTVRSQTKDGVTLNAQHTSPNSIIAPNDAIKFYGIYRIADATQTCSLSGANCDADLSFMGKWADGTAVTPALSTDAPVDLGPAASQECTAASNPRAANC